MNYKQNSYIPHRLCLSNGMGNNYNELFNILWKTDDLIEIKLIMEYFRILTINFLQIYDINKAGELGHYFGKYHFHLKNHPNLFKRQCAVEFQCFQELLDCHHVFFSNQNKTEKLGEIEIFKNDIRRMAEKWGIQKRIL